MKLMTGICQSSHASGGLLQFFRQEKTPFEIIKNSAEYPVIFFDEIFPVWAYDYIRNGGVAFVCGADKWTFDFDSGFVSQASLEYINLSCFGLDDTRIVSTVSLFSADNCIGSFPLHENRIQRDDTVPGLYPVIIINKIGKGTLLYTGIPFFRLLTVEGSTLRFEDQSHPMSERISSIDKNKLEIALRRILELCYKEAEFPLVRLWYYPNNADSVFAFRIDGEPMLPESSSALAESAISADLPYTIYISGERNEHTEGAAKRILELSKSNEIGSHAFHHNLVDGFAQNRENLRNCEIWLAQNGIPFQKVFAAPRGMYSADLGRALDSLGYKHSSDFSLAVSSLPFFPMVAQEQRGPLQLPVDSFNVLRYQKYCQETGLSPPSPTEILDIYLRLSEYKLANHLPILFFCHPAAFGMMSKEIYPDLVNFMRQKGVYPTTMIHFGDFWCKRDASEYAAYFENNELHIECDLSEEISLYVTNTKVVRRIKGYSNPRTD